MKSKTNIILGDGIAGYVIAACLDYLGEDFKIYGNNKYKAPDVLLLKTDIPYPLKSSEINNYPKANEYFKIFGIENKLDYLAEIKIGYMTTDDYITYNPSYGVLRDYYSKQGRKKSSSSMSDGKKSFVAIKLKDIYNLLADKYKEHHITSEITRDMLDEFSSTSNMNIYNTIFETSSNLNQPTFEYVVKEENPNVIDYVYDCRYYTKIKRFTKHYTEYFEAPLNKDYIVLKNYYAEPKIYANTNTKNTTIYDISRNATKTQLKIEDIIAYLLKNVNKV